MSIHHQGFTPSGLPSQRRSLLKSTALAFVAIALAFSLTVGIVSPAAAKPKSGDAKITMCNQLEETLSDISDILSGVTGAVLTKIGKILLLVMYREISHHYVRHCTDPYAQGGTEQPDPPADHISSVADKPDGPIGHESRPADGTQNTPAELDPIATGADEESGDPIQHTAEDLADTVATEASPVQMGF